MKKITFIIALLLSTTLLFAQKKDRVKGSKIVTLEQKEIGDFTSLEVSDQVEVSLVKGDKCGIEIEADDNIHDAIGINLIGTSLRITEERTVTSYKKFSVRINYTDAFRLIVARDKANVTSLAELTLDTITVKLDGKSKFFANIKSGIFTLEADGDTKTEINVKADKIKLVGSKYAEIKALTTTDELNIDLYQKSKAKIEGLANNLICRLDNDSDLDGEKLNTKEVSAVLERDAEAKINVQDKISIESSGKSELELFGAPKIEIIKFTDEAVLKKKK